MGFASEWLKTGTVFPEFIEEAPHESTGIIVVVPAFNETTISRLLDSLAECSEPVCRTEVIININAPQGVGEESLLNNIITQKSIESWEKMNKGHFFRLYCFNTGQPPFKKWGVGMARKSLMDEALRRFDFLNKPEGVIANLDADCTVQENYFLCLENQLLNMPGKKGCSIYFEHPLEGKEFSQEIYNSILQYELHLRYYIHALRYTGFPYLFHTVGSSFAVKSLPYMQVGGMNRRQAGEDFYFVQKLMPAGGYFSLTSTTVYPSPRYSERVPFGTGMVVSKMVSQGERQFITYNTLAFRDLKLFFDRMEDIYSSDIRGCLELYMDLPASIRSFVNVDEWTAKTDEISKNTSGYLSFRKRFFEWFNMFRVVKYLNHVHQTGTDRIPVEVAAAELLVMNGISDIPDGPAGLLHYFRQIDKNS